MSAALWWPRCDRCEARALFFYRVAGVPRVLCAEHGWRLFRGGLVVYPLAGIETSEVEIHV